MLKLKNSAMLVVAALCGYLALMTPDWKSQLVAGAGNAYEGDYNWNFAADILWRKQSTSENRLWTMNPDGTRAGIFFFPQYNLTDSTWDAVSMGDYNGDSLTDILYRSDATGYTRSWLINDTPERADIRFYPQFGGGTWSIVGSGDFDGDGNDDLLFREQSTGKVRIWTMNSLVDRSNVTFPAPLAGFWQVQAVGDFDADGDADIVWRDQGNTTGANKMWIMEAGLPVSIYNLPGFDNTNAWKIVGAGDFDADTDDDLLWINTSTGQQRIWKMEGGLQSSIIFLANVDSGFSFAGIADYNVDGMDDILYYNSTTGQPRLWYIDNGTKIGQKTLPVFGAGDTWKILGDRDS